jgi:hypothetical protein
MFLVCGYIQEHETPFSPSPLRVWGNIGDKIMTLTCTPFGNLDADNWAEDGILFPNSPINSPQFWQVDFASKLSAAHYVELKSIERQFLEAVQDARDYDEASPTARTRCVAFRLLWKASRSLLIPLPDNGNLYGDGSGGIRIEWRNGERQLRLVIHGSDPRYDYLYHQDGDEYDVETDLSPVNISGWLRWLTGQIK